MRKLFVLVLVLNCTLNAFSQNEIKSQSVSKYISFEPEYIRGLPPEVSFEISFEDANKNKILEANETAILKVKIENKGLGPAQGIKVNVMDKTGEGLNITGDYSVFFIFPKETKIFEIPIIASVDLKTEKHNLEILVNEHFGYDADPIQLNIQTLEYQSPKLVLSGLEVIDYGEGAMPVIEDGRIQPGELVKVKLFVQNVGLNVAKQSQFEVYSKDPNIYLSKQEGHLGNFEIGEVKEVEFIMSPNKRINVNEPLDVYLSILENTNDGSLKDFKLPIEINKRPKQAEIVDVAANIDDLKNQVKKFDLYNKSFKTNYGDLVDIFNVKKNHVTRVNAIGVIIGVEEYISLPPAPYAVNDAMIIEKYFKDLLGINEIVFLTNKDVTGLAFDDIFNPEYGELQKSIIKGETELFVFYSGHGIPNKKGDDVYLFPQDGKLERVEMQGYSLNKLYTSLESLGAKRVTLFLDACFSGASKTSETISTSNLVSMKGVRIEPKIKKPWENNENFIVFNSSSYNETSLAFDVTQTGLFTYYLCAGLTGKADKNMNNQITLGELKEYVIESVKETSKKIFGLQTPEFHGDEDYVILSY